ncbi:hypothetical protein [Tomitella fengzijianii]|nr:hypothetical protein [Tomitella fengzijianii]
MAARTTGESAAQELDEDLAPLADETAHQAQRVVAAFATDAAECRMFLSMLGIDPQPREE